MIKVGYDEKLPLSEVFISIQGEGPRAGIRSLFVRTAFCNLWCSWCIGYKPGKEKPTVLTTNGLKYLWQVDKGERLLTISEDGLLSETEVKQVFTRELDEYVMLSFKELGCIYLTPEHPLLTNEGWKEAKDVLVGDYVAWVPYLMVHSMPYRKKLPFKFVKVCSKELRPAHKGEKEDKDDDTIIFWNYRCYPVKSFIFNGFIVHNCDTKYTWDWKNHDIDQEVNYVTIKEIIEKLSHIIFRERIKNIVITGGEPLIHQLRLSKVIGEIKENNDVTVEVETNGTIVPRQFFDRYVTNYNCSPKLSNSGIPREVRIKPHIIQKLVDNEKVIFKFVVSNVKDIEEVVNEFVVPYGIEPSRVWIMPEGSEPATVISRSRWIVEECKKLGFNYSPRLHIILWGNKRGM